MTPEGCSAVARHGLILLGIGSVIAIAWLWLIVWREELEAERDPMSWRD